MDENDIIENLYNILLNTIRDTRIEDDIGQIFPSGDESDGLITGGIEIRTDYDEINSYDTYNQTGSSEHSYNETLDRYSDEEPLIGIDDFWSRYNGFNSIYYRYHYPSDIRNSLLDAVYFSINDMLSGENFMEDFIINEYMNNLEDVKVTITDDDFEKLDHSMGKVNEDCYICIETIYAERDLMTTLKCGHKYHKQCIKKWLCKQNTTCPVCRADVRQV